MKENLHIHFTDRLSVLGTNLLPAYLQRVELTVAESSEHLALVSRGPRRDTVNAALCRGPTEKWEWASQMGQHGGPKTEWERQSEWINRVPTYKSTVSGGRGGLGSVSLIFSQSTCPFFFFLFFLQFICIMDSKDMTL